MYQVWSKSIEGRTDGSITISLRNIVGEGIIKQQWTIEGISIFSNSSHLEWRVGLSDTILKGNHHSQVWFLKRRFECAFFLK